MNDLKLTQKMSGMTNKELVEFFTQETYSLQYTIAMNDRIPPGTVYEPVERAKAKIAQMQAYLLRRMRPRTKASKKTPAKRTR